MMAAAVVSSNHDKERLRREERERILKDLLQSVKQCQIRFGGRSELATESDEHVASLCKCLELVLSHGLRSKPIQNESIIREIVNNTFGYHQDVCFWHYVKQFLTKHEFERYQSLKKVWTDVGRGRAWLRSALNERCLDRYLHSMLANPVDAAVYYNDWALLMDQELNSTLPNMAAGLGPILFAIGIDDSRFNQVNEETDVTYLSRSEPILTVPFEERGISHHRRRRRTPAAHIISFDNEDEDVSSSDSLSAPPTCLSASVQSAGFLCAPAASPTSSNDSSFQDLEVSLRNKRASTVRDESHRHALTPMSDVNIGELIPVSGLDDRSQSGSITENEENLSVNKLNIDQPDDEDVKLLMKTLEQMKEMNAGLKIQLNTQNTKLQDDIGKLQQRLQALTRENEVLKHQLRKYVGAVQMLNRDGLAHEALACLEASKEAIQEREEAMQFQQKLVQVAEMHGELMEFNDRLQKQLFAKDDIIKRLEKELTDLRGPLPSSSLVDDDIPVPEALVNIWIPSAFLAGGTSDVHHVYQVYVRIREIEWNIYRRYAQFYALHKQLRQDYSIISTFDFPPKKTIGNKDSKFVEDRRIRLQRYLRQVVDVVVRARMDVSDPTSLISIIPFFGNTVTKEENKKKSRKTFSTRRHNEVSIDPSQYNGL